ncbi:hypothetical protein EW145_g4387, partial [Phellinidium pouzarii]
VEELDRADLGKKDKVEAYTIANLAEDATGAHTASRNIVRSYQDLARIMNRRLSVIASSSTGGDLFSDSFNWKTRAKDDLQVLAVDIRAQSTVISAHVHEMDDKLHRLMRDVLRTHEKYKCRMKFWGWMRKVFRVAGYALTLGGAITSLANCLFLLLAYADENTKIDDVLKYLREKNPQNPRHRSALADTIPNCARAIPNASRCEAREIIRVHDPSRGSESAVESQYHDMVAG